ncbi:NAD(P)-binding domain-containing protein [Candidatus Thiodiazotropha sp. CDECU1]|uniref:NAD(P)-binding domain-containing protein n=1 Tax=Candidatus Thiodiazotropha sp. CDECU1 TaxID=3065865 RepID=UPI003FA451B8
MARQNDKWHIETSKDTFEADHVVVATGREKIPYIPDWPGCSPCYRCRYLMSHWH